jgi:signal peptidase I
MGTAIRTIRRLLDAALVLLVLAVLALVLAANIGPRFGHEMVVIRGSSMTPAIPLGSVIDLVHVDPADLRPGDVVTLKEPAGAVITHRITRIVVLPDGLYIETKGDANEDVDTPVQPVSVVTGRVAASVPFLGFLMFLLSVPSGVLSVFSLAVTMLLMIWLLEDFETEWDGEEAEPAGDTEVSTVVATG